MNKKLIAIGTIILVAVLIFGCTQATKSTPTPTNNNAVTQPANPAPPSAPPVTTAPPANTSTPVSASNDSVAGINASDINVGDETTDQTLNYPDATPEQPAQ